MSSLQKKNVAIFASGTGTNAESLILRSFEHDAAYQVALLLSNNSTCRAMSMASLYFIDTAHVSTAVFPYPPDYDQAILAYLKDYCIDVVVLAGYMKKLPPAVVQKYRGAILNIHPSLLPKFGGRGMYGRFVHEAVLAAGDKESGVTIHLVNEEYDKGAVIAQEIVPVLPTDTAETLGERVRQVELRLYPQTLQSFVLSLPEKML